MTKYIFGVQCVSRPPLSRKTRLLILLTIINIIIILLLLFMYYYYYYYDGTAFKVRDASREGPLIVCAGFMLSWRGGGKGNWRTRFEIYIGKRDNRPVWKKKPSKPRDFV